MKERTVGVSDFKAKCLGILDEVASKGAVLVITRHGKPLVRVTPVSTPGRSTRDRWKGLGKIHGDIVGFSEADLWDNARPPVWVNGFPAILADEIIAATAPCHGLGLMTSDDRIRRWGGVPVV
jgi:prevent-host-death family protein